MDNIEFFTIERVSLDQENGITEYFLSFMNTYDKETKIEMFGLEKWIEIESISRRFETFTEAKMWLDVLKKDTERYIYSIVCKKYATEEDILERDGNCDSVLSLKTFYSTQEL